MLISVVLPVWNGTRFLEAALLSVLKQTWKNIEVIVVDDGSTDESPSIVSAIAKSDPRVRLLRFSTNQGVAKARNYGIDQAEGDLVAMLDCDDYWEEEKLEVQLKALKERDADFCFSSFYIIDKNRKKKFYDVPAGPITREILLGENVICTSSVLAKSQLMREHPFNYNYFHDDYVCWLSIASSKAVMVGVQKPLVVYRKGALTYSSNKLKCFIERWRVYRSYCRLSFWDSVYYSKIYALRGCRKHYFGYKSD